MIEIKNVTFHYAGLEQAGLSDINLTVPAGECVLLCGASGCGKTTITRLINGLIPHYYKGELTGEVKVNGKEIGQQEMYSLAGLVGSVFQNPRSQFFSVDTDGEITFGLENIGLPKEEILARKEYVLNDLNLRDLMNRSLFDLSGGEKQKIACGSVAALFPEIIILDEPSSNLDWDSIRDLSEMMKIWKQQGKTIIISEHRLWYLKDIIDRAVYLEKGRIIREWNRETFCLLTEEELASYELRPIHLEEKYIREFSDNKERIQAETTGAGNLAVDRRAESGSEDTVLLRDFYFTYTPKKYLLFKKKLLRRTRLCGLEKTCIGTVTMGGEVISGKKLRGISYMVMQDVNHQLFTDSVLSEVLLSMEEPDEKKGEKILEGLDLLEYKDKHPMALSGGQKQRVAIASAMAAKADILLFDEPTSGLDYRHMKEVSVLLRRLADMGKTVFVATHDPELCAQCCDRIIRISAGRAEEIA